MGPDRHHSSPRRLLVWSFFEANECFVGASVVAWDKVCVGSASSGIFALSKLSEEKLWEFHTDAGLKAPPSAAHQTIFVGDVDGRLYAVDALSGENR